MPFKPSPTGGLTVKFGLLVVPFILLATLNSGGYRYGASDQAFYQPAVLKQLDPALFPRDTAVLAAQTHLTAADEVMAHAVRLTGVSIPAVFAVLYVVSLALFAWGAWQIGKALYGATNGQRWTSAALLAALTLRHAIARSGTNTLEGYFQPRLLVYGLGTVAVAAFLRGRHGAAGVLLLLGAFVHPTTALWFGVWLAAATAIVDRRLRPWILGGGLVTAALGAWAVVAGPLAGRLGPMDAEWRAMLATKTYLFPLEWPAYAWIVNLGYVPLIFWIHVRRRRAGLVDARERGLVVGSLSLALVFAGGLVLQAFEVTLAYQLQPARVFWMFDFLAVVHVVWALCGPGLNAGRAVATALLCLSAARGAYVLIQADRPAVQLTIPDDDWGRVMAWARTTPKDSGWLAHPMHAVRYGTSVRVAGERDVFVEAVKDAALGMYDRRIAVRTGERLRAIVGFDALTADQARAIGATYDLDYLVTERMLPLPMAFQSGTLRVYRLQ